MSWALRVRQGKPHPSHFEESFDIGGLESKEAETLLPKGSQRSTLLQPTQSVSPSTDPSLVKVTLPITRGFAIICQGITGP